MKGKIRRKKSHQSGHVFSLYIVQILVMTFAFCRIAFFFNKEFYFVLIQDVEPNIIVARTKV